MYITSLIQCITLIVCLLLPGKGHHEVHEKLDFEYMHIRNKEYPWGMLDDKGLPANGFETLNFCVPYRCTLMLVEAHPGVCPL